MHFMIFRPLFNLAVLSISGEGFGQAISTKRPQHHSLKAPKIHCFSFCDRRGEVARGRWQFRLDRDIPRPPLTENNIWLARSVTKLTFTISESPFYSNHQAYTFYILKNPARDWIQVTLASEKIDSHDHHILSHQDYFCRNI